MFLAVFIGEMHKHMQKMNEKLYKGHSVLRNPLWGNYDLSNIKDMERQYSYAKEIGVDVFSTYQY